MSKATDLTCFICWCTFEVNEMKLHLTPAHAIASNRLVVAHCARIDMGVTYGRCGYAVGSSTMASTRLSCQQSGISHEAPTRGGGRTRAGDGHGDSPDNAGCGAESDHSLPASIGWRGTVLAMVSEPR